MSKNSLIIIDAGVENIRLAIWQNETINNILIPNNDKIDILFKNHDVLKLVQDQKSELFLTGKLAEIVKTTVGRGRIIMPGAALWSGANFLLAKHQDLSSLGIIDLSASGYMVVAVGPDGRLKDDLLITNPRCGAGSGINLSRILEKLAIKKQRVDEILKEYLGEAGLAKRQGVGIRADRCGVFSSSATISDKNQGLPLDFALAVTMKSEVIKACKKMLAGIEAVYLTGGVFAWQYCRDCAQDYLGANGVKKIFYDREQTLLIEGVKRLIEKIGRNNFKNQAGKKLKKPDKLLPHPSFGSLKEQYTAAGLFKRLPDPAIPEIKPAAFQTRPVNIGLDVGSTMAKMLITDAVTGEIIFISSSDNHGDTVETIKHIFQELVSTGVSSLNIQRLGITGSGRYQIEKVLKKVYPKIADKIFVLVENYAHARGSIEYAKNYIQNLKKHSAEVNHDFCALVDIGGEDTKVSIISLKKQELFDNVMNIKCSAGTGSLMDTLKSIFNIKDIKEACRQAYEAPRAYEINATCAVFLMENAKKMQALGYAKNEILASCNYAIVENMARTLWNQVKFPENAVVLLHGQTMLSDPLPLAVTRRLQEFGTTYALVPPLPGHRACLGLIKSIRQPARSAGTSARRADKNLTKNNCRLTDLINLKFDKRIITCRGAVCGDSAAACSRTLLSSVGPGEKLTLTLGGCTAVNEFQAKTAPGSTNLGTGCDSFVPTDAYKEIWQFMDSAMPKSTAPDRLVIPRSFAVSEQAFFLAKIFEKIGLPIAVDNVLAEDILNAQSLFNIDVCAPLIGATGQFIRLAQSPHGLILAPQIDFLPTDNISLGRTCTTNQGGVIIAWRQAKLKFPKAKFFSFVLSLKKTDPEYLTSQLYNKITGVFNQYKLKITRQNFKQAVAYAIRENQNLKERLALKTAGYIEQAIEKKRNLAVVCGREYILHPDIYDSHVGKLLFDKGVTAIPAYALETELNPDFAYIYWRNPHDLLTKIKAIADKELHLCLKHPRLKQLVKAVETGQTDSLISSVRVSTFRCGPDTVTMPVIAEITKNAPSLYLQSDAMIKELAHLENRVNTFLNQLSQKLHEEFTQERFEIKLVEEFGRPNLNKDTDVIYFPTLHDNRPVVAVFRAAGLTVIDNYNDETYDLESKVRLGRKYAGDSVCAPLAAVFADVMLSYEDFLKRKKSSDPLLKDKTRILVFDNKGTGPCRQGQYYEMHKLLLSKQFSGRRDNNLNQILDQQIKLLVAHEKEGFNVGLDEWALVQSFQGVVLQGVLHALLLRVGAACRDYDQYQEFYQDYIRLKDDLYKIIETKSRPNKTILAMAKTIGKKSLAAGAIFKYFGYGLYKNNGLRKNLKEFAGRWSRRLETENQSAGTDKRGQAGSGKIKIHIEGEAYMRVAQVEELFKSLIDALGFQSFVVTYSPLWCYLELLLEFAVLECQNEIDLSQDMEKSASWRLAERKEKRKLILKIKSAVKILRLVLAGPLYRAAKVEMPEKMSEVLESAKQVLPSLKPHGELPPYLGEAIMKIKHGTDLFLNVAPEGCMVSSMAQLFSQPILKSSQRQACLSGRQARIQDLFTLNGEVNEEQLRISLLKTLGPERYYTAPFNKGG